MRVVFPLLVLLGAACAPVSVRDERFSPAAGEAAGALRQQIMDETGRPDVADWAGEYTGLSTNLLLAPQAGYVFELYGCCGVYDRNFGDVRFADGRLHLSFTFENCRTGPLGIAPELIPVRWGPRLYLVPADDVIGFCNDVNSGAEPRTSPQGSSLLRCGDEDKPVTGQPELPAEDRGALLSRPIEATVLAAGETTSRPSIADWNFFDTPLTLDAGAAEGLRVGMQLYQVQPVDSLALGIRITQVGEHRADAILTRDCDPIFTHPEPGWRLSTRPAWRPMEAAPSDR